MYWLFVFIFLCAFGKAQSTEQFLESGKKKYESRDFTSALADFSSAVKSDSLNPNAWYKRALCEYELKQYDKSLKDLQRAEKLSPDFESVRIYTGLCYFRQKNYQRALSEFDHIITLHPDNDVAFYDMGMVKYEMKEYDEAIKDFATSNKLLETAEKNSYLGLCYFKKKKYTDAISFFSSAIAIDSSDADFYYDRGLAFFQLKNYNKALKDFSKSVKLDPSSYQSHYDKGMCHFLKAQYDEALKEFNETIRLEPKYHNGFVFKGACLYCQKKFAEARKEINAGLALQPKSDEAHYYLGWMLADEGNSAGAIAEFTKSIGLGAKAATFYARALCYLQQADYNAAKADLQQGLLRDKNNGEYVATLANCFYFLGDNVSALKNLDEALAKDSSLHKAFFVRGQINYESGRDELAIKDFSKAISLMKDAEYFLYRAAAYRQLKKYEEAINDLTECLKLKENYFKAFLERGICNYYAQHFSEALKDVSAALKLDTKSGKAWFYSGAIKAAMGDKSACGDYKKSLSLGYKLAQQEITANKCN